jgi:benzil reductase ((S)-benzoin forming)
MADRCAVVTGVSKGLGEAIAANLIARGFDVIGIGRSAAARLATNAFRLVIADLAEMNALPALVDSLFDELATRRLGSIAVFNNAAVGGPTGTFGQLEPDEVVASLAVNLAAPMIVANAFVRAFRLVAADRRLINVSSGAAARPIPGGGVYNVAKAGLEMLTSAIAAEQPASGLRAITVRPGIIDTPMQTFMRSQPAARLPAVDMFQAFHENRQLVPPDVVAAKIVDRLVVGPIENGRIYSYAEL